MDKYLIMLILGIILITSLLYYVIRDLRKVIDLSSKITLLTGIFLVLLGYLIRYLVLNNIQVINLNNAVNVVVNKFLTTSIYLIIISIIEQLVVRLFIQKRAI